MTGDSRVVDTRTAVDGCDLVVGLSCDQVALVSGMAVAGVGAGLLAMSEDVKLEELLPEF